MTVVVLTNLEHADPPDITHHVAGLYISALTPDPKPEKPTKKN
jgi:hypothetical protein